MSLETGNTINDLSRVDPKSSDLLSEADNHLRLIKGVLKDQFPGSGGEGYAEAITAVEDDLNNTTGSTGNFQGQITINADAIAAITAQLAAELFPSGTRMVMHQAACPTGWTQDVSITNHMLVAVDGAGGGTGGTDDPTTTTHNHTTGDHTLVEAEIPSHNHYTGMSADPGEVDTRFGSATDTSQGRSIRGSGTSSTQSPYTSDTGGGSAHNHGITDDVVTAPQYAECIICVKD